MAAVRGVTRGGCAVCNELTALPRMVALGCCLETPPPGSVLSAPLAACRLSTAAGFSTERRSYDSAGWGHEGGLLYIARVRASVSWSQGEERIVVVAKQCRSIRPWRLGKQMNALCSSWLRANQAQAFPSCLLALGLAQQFSQSTALVCVARPSRILVPTHLVSMDNPSEAFQPRWPPSSTVF